MMTALAGLSTSAHTRGRTADADQLMERLMGLARASEDPASLSFAHVHMAKCRLLAGRFAETSHHLQSARRLSAEALIPLAEENPASASYATFFSCRALLRTNRIEEAKAKLKTTIEFNDLNGLRLMRAWELQTEAECYAIAGKLEDALAVLSEGLRKRRSSLIANHR